MSGQGTLGIIAGGGDLPLAIAESAKAAGRSVFVIGLEGMADPGVGRFEHGFAAIGELGKLVRLLKQANVSHVTFAGRVARPNFSALKLDTRGALALPRVVAAARHGDDAMLRVILALFEREGMTVVGTEQAAPGLIAGEGALGKHRPSERDRSDLSRAVQIVRALGTWDVGQSAVVCEGLVLAVEAAEGTDEMMRRVAQLPEALRGTPAGRRGVLVKAVKPGQEKRVDLPVIGTRTVELAAAAGLSGIAVEAGAALIMNRAAVAPAADAAGLFVYGFSAADVAE